MSYNREQAQLIRTLKGAAASILLALALTADSLENKDLQLITGYSDKSITAGLALLEFHGLIQRTAELGWTLTGRMPARRKISGLLDSSSSDPDQKREEEEMKEETARGAAGDAESVKRWLVRAGIGRNSPKLRQLLGLSLSERYVKAWVLEFEWWKQNHTKPGFKGREVFSVGTLIHILLSGDQSPPMRCDGCLMPLPCYCGIIKR